MEYTKRRRYTVNHETNLQDIYQHDLQMYDFPPSGEIPLVEFERLCLERLKLLKHIESNGLRTDCKTFDERKQNLNTSLIQDGLKHFAHLLYGKGCKSSTETELQYRRRDHISHFILRFAYCLDQQNQMWYINQEVEYFKLRFSSLDKEGIEKLLSMHTLDCQQLAQEEKDEIREELRSSTFKVSNIDAMEFYKVPFQKVTDLIKSRRVYVSGGIAYIPQSDLMSLFVTYFRKNICDIGIPDARSNFSNVSHDERLSFLFNLTDAFSSQTRVTWSTNATPIEKLDELSKTSYPLCMRTLHDALKTTHHLRNSGRIQYGLFMKGIGVTLEDALQFWKSEFTKKIDTTKFDKEYAYSIRHIFGKEGKQTNYTPLGCGKIISSNVGPGEYHGCPYKHMDYESLKQKLLNSGIPVISINEIADLAKGGHYLLACQSYFKVVHNRLPNKPINNPNTYFAESRAILAKDNPPESESKEKLSQSVRLNEKVGTPKRMDRSIGTPARIDRSIGTPVRNAATPSRSMDGANTPSRPTERTSMTPSRASKATPKRIENHLNDDEIAELMSSDIEM